MNKNPSNALLNASNEHATITLGVTEYQQLLNRIDRLERLFMKRRELAIIELGSVEDEMGLIRTKEKRNNGTHRAGG